MALTHVDLNLGQRPPPPEVHALLVDAAERIDNFVEARRDAPIPAFVPSDFVLVYQSLLCIEQSMLAPGYRFVEWGSGLGVATCLAGMLHFDAVGIEIEPELVDLSRELAAEHGIEVEFVEGSYLPTGSEEIADRQTEITWLRTDGVDAYAQLELEPDDFDLVFTYPWPGEEQIVFDLFNEYCGSGALLLTFHGQEGIRLQRKIRHLK